MNEKKVFILSVVFVAVSAFLSFLMIYGSFSLLYEVQRLHNQFVYSADGANGENEKYSHFEANIVTFKPAEEQKSGEEKNEINVSLGKFKVTAYCSCKKCCGKWAENRPVDENGKEIVYGSTGEILTAGVSIAVDPAVIPYGSVVEFNNHTYTAHDTGSAIKGNRIDVYFDDHQEALEFGVQYAEVFLIGGQK